VALDSENDRQTEQIRRSALNAFGRGITTPLGKRIVEGLGTAMFVGYVMLMTWIIATNYANRMWRGTATTNQCLLLSLQADHDPSKGVPAWCLGPLEEIRSGSRPS